MWRPGNCPTSAYPVTKRLSIQVPADIDTELYGSAILNEVQWHVGQEIWLLF
jgi:hypothetical protein